MFTFVLYRQYVLRIALCVSQYVSYRGFFRIDPAPLISQVPKEKNPHLCLITYVLAISQVTVRDTSVACLCLMNLSWPNFEWTWYI